MRNKWGDGNDDDEDDNDRACSSDVGGWRRCAGCRRTVGCGWWIMLFYVGRVSFKILKLYGIFFIIDEDEEDDDDVDE